ncbi:MAG: M28 family metallopeptidase [Vicinamibacteria bacterium]|nr:M28 family metallopeptidase [Vicinamibacteria bacterium]
MNRFWTAGLSVLLLNASAIADDGPLRGFTAESAAEQRQWEEKLRALPNADNLRESMRLLSARPHHVGSAYGKQNAEWILARFKEWGWDAQIETFGVLFPTPKGRLLEMTEPKRFVAALDEPALAIDPTSGQKTEQLPTYNSYSVDGDVTAPLVFVNYGLPEDYDRLERLGISVKGAIVIAKYGGSWRGIKPKVAAEHGAVGCIIYSDPKDDGYFVDDVFPKGPMRPANGVQRGSVMDFSASWPGDPLTPGIGATTDAKRLDLKDAKSLTRIPVLPISYGDAQPLLAALGGPMAPVEWRGALPISYHVGPGPAKVHLKLAFNWDIKPVHDVIARIPGSSNPEQWVVRGNHHDAWVNGAEDPISAMVVMLEEARALGELVKQGWRPKRTIVFAAWDGEEPMLLGSTEWAEAHAAELREHAVAYINTDGNGRGYLSMGGSHTLERFINDVARDIKDPETGLSVKERRRLAGLARVSAEDRAELRNRHDLRIDALGSGTDFTAFLDHLGVPSIDLAFGGEDDGGIYHSIYDDFYWYTHFSDTDFAYGKALAQTVGTAVLRLADADLLPFEFTGLADTVKMYLKELRTLADNQRNAIVERNRQIEEGVFRAAEDPRRKTVAPTHEEVPPFLNFAPMENASVALERSASRYEAALAKAWAAGVPAATIQKLNQGLKDTERLLTDDAGLPRRAWYKHLLYAPGVYTGYNVKTVPAVREAIEAKAWAEAETEIARVAKALMAESDFVNGAAVELERHGSR